MAVLVHGPIVMDVLRRTVTVDGRPMKLTALELRLLEHFMRDPGLVLGRDRLPEAIWRYLPEERTATVLDVAVSRLRKKLGEARALVETVRGFGYRLKEDPSAADQAAPVSDRMACRSIP